jgi:hypothetical protein
MVQIRVKKQVRSPGPTGVRPFDDLADLAFAEERRHRALRGG